MVTSNKTEIEREDRHRVVTGFLVDTKDLTLFVDAIIRWEQFINKIFTYPTKGSLSTDLLERLALEDTEHYLDIKIQLSQCMRMADEVVLQHKLEDICETIRKSTYHHVSTVLPHLAENNRSLIELANKGEQSVFGKSLSKYELLSSPDLEISQEYKDCLVLQHKQLKTEMEKQGRKVKTQVLHLKKVVKESFHTQHA